MRVCGAGWERKSGARASPRSSSVESPPGPRAPPSALASHSDMADVKRFTRKEISEKDPKQETVFVINNVVYNVTKFLDEHPGGHEVLVNVAGKDGSEDFDDVGHSFDAKELMRKYVIGELVDEDKVQLKKRQVSWEDSTTSSETTFMSSWKFPLVMGILMTFLYSYLFG